MLEALKAGRNIQALFISSGRHDSPKVIEIKKEAAQRNISIVKADAQFFYSSFPKGHQGVAAKVLPKTYSDLEELLRIPITKGETPLFIILDCIEDPRNFGAIVRVADAAGVHGVIIQSYRSAPVGPEVSKSSAGAVEYVPVTMVPNIKHAIKKIKESGITVVGADAGAENVIWDLDLKIPLALIIGAEGKGLRKTVKEHCDILVRIPMLGKINSLNVSVAAGVVLFDILRQKMKNN